jgi:hypothetical protein
MLIRSRGLSVHHRKHIISPLWAQQVNAIYRFVTWYINILGHYPASCLLLKHSFSKTGFRLRLQAKTTQLCPIESASLSPDRACFKYKIMDNVQNCDSLWMCLDAIICFLFNNVTYIAYYMEVKRNYVINKKNSVVLSPRANYTDRATAACRRSDSQLLRIEGATWSAWRIPTAIFSVL